MDSLYSFFSLPFPPLLLSLMRALYCNINIYESHSTLSLTTLHPRPPRVPPHSPSLPPSIADSLPASLPHRPVSPHSPTPASFCFSKQNGGAATASVDPHVSVTLPLFFFFLHDSRSTCVCVHDTGHVCEYAVFSISASWALCIDFYVPIFSLQQLYGAIIRRRCSKDPRSCELQQIWALECVVI